MGCAQSKPDVYRVAPAPPEGSSAPGLERRSTGRIYADALKTGEGASQEKEYDAYLSFEATAASLAAEVRSSLEGYQLPAPTSGLKEKLATLRASRRVVIFLTPKYFSDAGCCAEFCEAVAAGIEVLPVCVEGSTWSGMPFPALTDVPEKMETPVGTKAPRDAAGAVFGHTIAIEHKAAYVSAFVLKLRERLGQPSSSLSPKVGGKKLLTSAAAADSSYDAFLSHKRSEAQDTVARVHDKLTDAGYRAFIDRNDLVELPQLKLAVRESSVLVFFLTPLIFQSAWCCLELCEAVEHKVPILFVIHDGAQWGGRTFPQLTDVPETITVHATEDIVLRPREAFAKAEKSAARLDHARSYFPDFVDKLKDSLGPPPAVADLEGEAKSMWQAAGGGFNPNPNPYPDPSPSPHSNPNPSPHSNPNSSQVARRSIGASCRRSSRRTAAPHSHRQRRLSQRRSPCVTLAMRRQKCLRYATKGSNPGLPDPPDRSATHTFRASPWAGNFCRAVSGGHEPQGHDRHPGRRHSWGAGAPDQRVTRDRSRGDCRLRPRSDWTEDLAQRGAYAGQGGKRGRRG